MTDFIVDPVIAGLTHTLADWPLCRVFLYNDSRYHWGLLVPRRPGAIEMCDLAVEDQRLLMAEIVRLSNLIRPLPGVEKLNVGNLGNMVPQLHVHVIGRFAGRSRLAGAGLGPQRAMCPGRTRQQPRSAWR